LGHQPQPNLLPGDYIFAEVIETNGRNLQSFIRVGPDFEIMTCCLEEAGTPINGLINDIPGLNYLRFEVKRGKDQEPLYTREWRADMGETPPHGFFRLLDPDQTSADWIGAGLEFTLYGQDSHGNVYSASEDLSKYNNCEPLVSIPKFAIELKTSSQVASACDSSASGKVSLVAGVADWPPPVFPMASLKYYVERQGQWRLVRSLDLTKESWGPVEIDTYAVNSDGIYLYEEGQYRVNAVAVDSNGYTADYSADHSGDSDYPVFVVDRVIPEAQITAPVQDGDNLICPALFQEQGKPPRRYVDLNGLAQDDRGLHGYKFMYAYEATPNQWFDALDLSGAAIAATGTGREATLAGRWDVGNLIDEQVLLKFQVFDQAGNVRCHVEKLKIDIQHELTAGIDRKLFSPNGDGLFDTVTVTYDVDETVALDAVVLSPTGTVIKTLLTGFDHAGGKGEIEWDGTDNGGQPAADGSYSLRLTATDGCGNASAALIEGVEIDKTPPVTEIDFPGPGDTISTIVEVLGTAYDPHFSGYRLEVLDETQSDPLQTLANETIAVQNGYLGRWNTYGAEGRRRLRLTASDSVGNSAESIVLIDLGVRQELITDLAAAPLLFSPNNDGRLESVAINYSLNGNLNQSFNVGLEIMDQSQAVVRTFQRSNASGGPGSFVWDGLNASGQLAPDGTYQAVLTAGLATNTSITHKEKATITLDATAPVAQVDQPADQAFIPAALSIRGSVTDANLDHYTLILAGSDGPQIVDQGQSNRQNHPFADLADLKDGAYTLTLQAQDRGLIDTVQALRLTIDKTAPRVLLASPAQGALFGHENSAIAISGTIEEENIALWQLRYRSQAAAPDAWSILAQGEVMPADALLHTWSVGAGDGVADGEYVISLLVADKAGWQTEAAVGVTVDNTAPRVVIGAPTQGSYIKAPVSVDGAAEDLHLASYDVATAPGTCDGAYQWLPIHHAEESVSDGTLAQWRALPPDGPYCLRLVAEDRVGLRSEAEIDVTVDTHPPAAPILSGEIEDRSNARLKWSENTEEDFYGYDLYRDGAKLNTTVLTTAEYLDQSLQEGSHVYTVRAVDRAGWESEPSNAVSLEIDLSAPITRIRVPADGATVCSQVSVKGTAYSDDDFKEFRLYAGQGTEPSSWQLLNTSRVATAYGELGQWETGTLSDGSQYSLRLVTEDLAGNTGEHRILVTIDNQPPAAPVLLTAESQGPLSSTADVAWQANGESDLAGYLLYRNGDLANTSGTVIGDLAPYLLGVTAYSDADLPDGTYEYYLQAMDTAGNISAPSNRLSVTIDTRAPQARITTPQTGFTFDESFMIRATCPDLDVAAVQFQYQAASAAEWIDLNTAVTGTPFITYLDPAALGLSYGTYNLRAVATDVGGRTDSAPPAIAVVYNDITAPDAPIDLEASVNGGQVTLTWTANDESDLAGYNIYEIRDDQRVRLNSVLVDQTTYIPPGEEDGLPDNHYDFQVFAVDGSGNESPGSNVASALVYTPQLEQPFTPTATSLCNLFGEAMAADQVELFIDTGSGTQSLGTVGADDQGHFTFSLSLSPGVNRIFARAADGQGNFSKASAEIVVVHATPPAAPTGLTSDVADHDVVLNWNSNQESDLAGYNVYRDGLKQNLDQPVVGGTASASISGYSAQYALDGYTYSYWEGYINPGEGPVWWQYDIGQTMLISQVSLDWYDGYTPPDSFELQAWSGYTWIPLVRVMGNTQTSNRFDILPAYATDRIRLVIFSGDVNQTSVLAFLSEFKMQRLDLIPTETYLQQVVPDGRYDYHLEAVNTLGMVSPPSQELQVDVGDVTPPEAPISLQAAADGSTINLTWSAPEAPDLVGYRVYRLADDQWQRLTEATATATTYADADLTNGSYTYRVTALDAVGNESNPSNEAAATVNLALPAQPINVTAAPQPQGGTIQVCWEAVSGASGYYLYRSTISGGPYTLVTPERLTGTCYLDTGLTDGETYFYTVHAVDALGNESTDSLEANAVPADLIAPPAPVLFAPTIAGVPITVSGSRTDISGWSEPGAWVTLYRNGFYQGATRATAGDNAATYSFLSAGDDIGQVYKWAISPDGRYVAYTTYDYTVYNYVCRIYDATSGSWVTLTGYVDSFAWSPDSNWLAFPINIYNGMRIALFDVHDKQMAPITDDAAYFDERTPAWSADGSRLLYVSNQFTGNDQICSYDLGTGQVEQLVDAPGARFPLLSPDSRRLGYLIPGWPQSQLYMTDLQGGDDPVLVDDRVQMYSSGEPCIAWSPSSTALAYVANAGGATDIYAADAVDQTVEPLTSSGRVRCFTWLPGGRHIAYLQDDGSFSLWVQSLGQAEARQVTDLPLDDYFSGLGVSAQGRLGYRFGDSVALVNLAGAFTFEDIPLSQGQNAFHATAADPAGNISPSSDSIVVQVDGDQLPDLQVTAGDLYHYPYVPIAGQQVRYTAIIRNAGAVSASDVQVDCYVWDASDQTKLVHTTTIPSLAAGEEHQVQFQWDSTGLAGRTTLIVELDPEDTVFEAVESNNMAFKNLYVAAAQGLAMETTTQYDLYNANEDVNITVELYNASQADDVTLEVSILDSQQAPVALVAQESFSLPYTPLTTRSFIWNTERAPAGDYFVRAVLSGTEGQLAENLVPFTIEAALDLKADLYTDRLHYDSFQTVQLHASLSNQSPNMVLSDLTTRMVVRNAAEEILAEQIGRIDYLFSGGSAAVNVPWSTGTYPPGEYWAIFIVEEGPLEVARVQRTFFIDPVSSLSGSLSVHPAIVASGANVSVDYSLAHSGNTAISGLPVEVAVLDPANRADLATALASVDIDLGGTHSGTFQFTTTGYAPGIYPVQLRSLADGGGTVLAEAAFTVQSDAQMPVQLSGTLVSDPSNVLAGDWITLRYTITNESSVNLDQLNLRVSVPDAVAGDFQQTLTLPAGVTLNGSFDLPTSALIPDSYTSALLVRLTGNLGEAELSRATYTVVAPEPRIHAPVAIAGGPYLAAVGETIQVDGSASFDSDEGLSDSGQEPYDGLTDYRWEIHMVQPYDFDDATGAIAELPAYDTAGTHTIVLQVTDNTAAAFPSEGLPDLTATGLGQVEVYVRAMDDLSARPKSTKCQLTWSHIGAAEYEILRSESGPNAGFETIGTTDTTYCVFTDYNIELNKDYWYRVRCVMGEETRMSVAVHVISTGRVR
jgi:Tol biopolymer transport system component/fibronectin type 3 domain-containing protein/flagellar hook assembly protein FlgD